MYYNQYRKFLIHEEVIRIQFLPMGDHALHLIVGDRIDLSTHRRVVRLHQQLKQDPIPEVIEWVPTYQAITFFYSPKTITYDQLCFEVEKRWLQAKQQTTSLTTRRIEIPVL